MADQAAKKKANGRKKVARVNELRSDNSVPAGIEYAGVSGSSEDCQNAILRLIHFGDRITNAKILTSGRDHCLLLTINVGDLVAVKSGFASGYLGTGPRTFSYVLQVLEVHGTVVEEYIVPSDFIERLDQSALTAGDLAKLERMRPKRPTRWRDYILDRDWKHDEKGLLWRDLPLTIPLAVIDGRLIDLALAFWDAPDDKLMKGYRRLEDIVRRRTGLKLHSAKLFSQAFNPTDGKLTWDVSDDGERAGRMSLFTGAYTAHRNPRAHGELDSDSVHLLTEFLLLNHLYHLEGSAGLRQDADGQKK